MRQVKWSFTRGSYCKALTVLWIGGCLWEVVAYDRSSHMEVGLYYILYSSVLSLSKIYCLYRPDQGLQPSHQEGSIYSPADDGLPPPSSQGWSRLSVKTWEEPSSTSAQPQTPSLSRAEWNRAVYSLPLPSACFSSYCCLTPSASQINGVYLNTRSDGNLTRFRAKTKVRKVLIREMLL